MRKIFATTLIIVLYPSLFIKAQYCPVNVTGTLPDLGLLNVTLNTLNSTSLPEQGYEDFTATDTAILTRGGIYDISVTGGYNMQNVEFWIDYNNDNIFQNDHTQYNIEKIPANTPKQLAFTVSPTAILGTTRMRVSTVNFPTAMNPCDMTQSVGDIEDYTIIIDEDSMEYLESTTFQRNNYDTCNCLSVPRNNVMIIGIEILTEFTLNPLDITSLTFNTNGTTNLASISNAKVWYTGTSDTFATTSQYGTTIATGTTITVNGNIALMSGKNYFWLTFDINGTPGDIIDAECTNLTIDGIARIPTIQSPPDNIMLGIPVHYDSCMVFTCNPTSYKKKRANIWYFGGNAGLDFNCEPPQPIGDGVINTDEGCASIADNNGNLLFYTDGISVWDKTHTAMPNADGSDWEHSLAGSSSSTQSAMITPVIGEANKYYIFSVDGLSALSTPIGTVGPKGSWDGLFYTIVDMNLRGGLGAIDTAFVRAKTGIAGNKIGLVDSIGERITAAIHTNGIDYWIITRKHFSNEYYAFLVCDSGVNSVGVKTSIGTGGIAISIGTLVSSLDGKMLMDLQYGNVVQAFDFNNLTGMLSNRRVINTDGNQMFYSAAFSSNDSIIYLSSPLSALKHIRRYKRYAVELGLGAISSTETIDTMDNNIVPGGFQLAPNGKIYVTSHVRGSGGGTNFGFNLTVIHNPNNFSNPDIVGDGQPLFKTATPRMVLPHFFNAYDIDPKNKLIDDYAGKDTVICIGESLQIGADSFPEIIYSWLPVTDINNVSISNPIVNPSSTTEYIVSLQTMCGIIYDTIIVIVDTFVVDAGNDTLICQGNSTVLNATTSAAIDIYSWFPAADLSNPNIANPIANPVVTTTYYVGTIDTNTACSYIDSVLITVASSLLVDIGKDTFMCRGEMIVFDASNPLFDSYLWSTGEASPSISISDTGVYWVKVTNASCQGSDTVIIDLCPLILVPNAFSPNGDGENDVFRIRGEGISQYVLKIYNRWGHLVHESSDFTNFWDGKINGQLANEGVYVYAVDVIFNDTIEELIKGNLTLVR